MEKGVPYIRLKLDVPTAIELGDFVGAFTALASEYDRFARLLHAAPSEARLYVSEVRQGSIIAHLQPYVGVLSQVASLAGQALDLEDFVRRYGHRLALFVGNGRTPEDVTRAELRDFLDQTGAIAATPGSTLQIAAMEVEDGEHKVKVAFQFGTKEAREIQDKVEIATKRLEHTARSDRERVMMVFTRSDVRAAPVGKRSGEQIVIEAISDRPRPLIYASELAERQIKHEITEEEDNVYKKGFIVDVNVETRGGQPAAYAVTNLHQVIDLPDDD